MANLLLFVVFPYLAVTLAVIVGSYRFFSDCFSYSSLSSQFLERNLLFWGSVHFHYAILIILLSHLLAALFPKLWAALLGSAFRLYLLEITGITLGSMAIIGLAMLLIRRFANAKVKVVTTRMDLILLVVLLLQAISGVYVATAYRWGSLWYLNVAVPWLWSLAKLTPDVSFLVPLPWMAKFHMFNAFLLLAILPFSRLVHLLSLPISYLWRPQQVVIWNRAQQSRNA